MLKILFVKLREALVSVLPVTAIVFLMDLTPLVDFSTLEIVTFLIASVFLVIGIGLFNLGADMAMTPMAFRSDRGFPNRARWGCFCRFALRLAC